VNDTAPTTPVRPGPAGGTGGVLEKLDARARVAETTPEPVPSLPFPVRANGRVRQVGELRLPLAGPYRPRARLFRYPDGRLLWLVRLWEYDRPVPHLLSTEVLREFARRNGLPRLRSEIDALVERIRSDGRT